MYDYHRQITWEESSRGIRVSSGGIPSGIFRISNLAAEQGMIFEYFPSHRGLASFSQITTLGCISCIDYIASFPVRVFTNPVNQPIAIYAIFTNQSGHDNYLYVH
jgi:hypothetical protein